MRYCDPVNMHTLMRAVIMNGDMETTLLYIVAKHGQYSRAIHLIHDSSHIDTFDWYKQHNWDKLSIEDQDEPGESKTYGNPASYKVIVIDYCLMARILCEIRQLLASQARPLPAFSMLHAEKREGLVREITCVTYPP